MHTLKKMGIVIGVGIAAGYASNYLLGKTSQTADGGSWFSDGGGTGPQMAQIAAIAVPAIVGAFCTVKALEKWGG